MEIHSSRPPRGSPPPLAPASTKQEKAGQQGDTFTPGESERIQRQWQALPDVRPEVVERVREALSRGGYPGRDLVEKAAGRLASELFPGEGRLR